MIDRLNFIANELCQKWDVELIELRGEPDHVRLLLKMHPNITPSKFINNLKTVTSRLLRKDFAEHLSVFYSKPVLWARAYCLMTVGDSSESIIEGYINKQGKGD